MKILVTGHMGYIGTVLTPMLTKLGHDVHGLDSDLYSRCTYGKDAPAIPQTLKDVRDAELEDVQGFDAIMHLAGLSNDPLGDINSDLTYDINYKASVRLAELAKKAGVPRFLFSSSCSNYGAGGQDMLNEDSELNPVTPYGKSKVMVEKDLAELSDGEFTTVYLRNATAYGVSPRLRFDLVLNNLTAWAVTTGKVLLKSDGSPWRPIVHIEDISRAFVALMNADKELVNNRSFNVGVPNENFRIRDLANLVHDTVPDSVVGFADGASPDKRNYKVDCTRLPNEVPEYKAAWTAAKGVKELYETYKTLGLTLDEFEGIKYRRVDHIKWLIDQGVIDHNLRHINGAG